MQKENKHKEEPFAKHIQTIETRNLCQSAKNGGCGECQTSCQSACKTSSDIANQKCGNKKGDNYLSCPISAETVEAAITGGIRIAFRCVSHEPGLFEEPL